MPDYPWTPEQGEHYRLEMHRHSEEKAALMAAIRHHRTAKLTRDAGRSAEDWELWKHIPIEDRRADDDA